MRLWHSELISSLPRQQLIAQWRECVALAKDIYENCKVNHILVNKINDYPTINFNNYCNIVLKEMLKRSYNVSTESINKLKNYINFNADSSVTSNPYPEWHNKDYLFICYYNLKEKFLCGGIDRKEWNKFQSAFIDILIKYEDEFNV